MWIIDFGVDTAITEAALYEAPFQYLLHRVEPIRRGSRTTQRDWWIHERPGHSMRIALHGLGRYFVTPRVAKHRLFAWIGEDTLADCATVAFARNDDYTFGLLHSRVHELWARATGTQLREAESGFRYTPTTCFETFPFPRPTSEQREAIAVVAVGLDRLRQGWLIRLARQMQSWRIGRSPVFTTRVRLGLPRRTSNSTGPSSARWLAR